MKPQDHPLYEGIIEVAAAVQAAERAADDTIISAAELAICTLKARQRFGVSPHAAQPAMDHLRRAIDISFEGWAAIVAAHSEYGRIAAAAGATPETWGPTWPCTDGKAGNPPAESHTLRVAA